MTPCEIQTQEVDHISQQQTPSTAELWEEIFGSLPPQPSAEPTVFVMTDADTEDVTLVDLSTEQLHRLFD